MRERTFMRGDKTVSTRVPAAATDLIARGYREIEVPTRRPRPLLSEPIEPPVEASAEPTRTRRPRPSRTADVASAPVVENAPPSE